jgi:CP family cyanate transporter-like MFS transporter
LRFVALWLSGICLRVTILAVPPVLPLIHRDLGLGETAVGVLSGLPVLLLGVAAVPGSVLISRLGARTALVIGLVTIAIAAALRGVGPSAGMLFAMTFVMCAGVAIMQPALPTLVARWLPGSVGVATAVYVNGLLVGETLGAALTIPLLPFAGGSWEAAIAVWSIPVALTALLVAFATPPVPRAAAAMRAWSPPWRDPRVWQLGVLQGGISALYFGTIAFIPDFLHAVGRSELIGPALSADNGAQIPSSIVLIFFANRLAGRKAPLIACVVAALCGLPLLLTGVPTLVVLGAAMLGFFGAGILTLALALPPLLALPSEVHRLSAGMFTLGYGISFLVPLLGGLLWDNTHVPATAFLPVAIGALGIIGAALAIRLPKRTVVAA